MTEIIFNQSLEVLSPRLIESPYSSEMIEDWDRPVYTPVLFGVSVQPASSTEGDEARPQTVTRMVLITPPGTDIPELDSDSRVRVGGVLELTVVGVPARWPDPHHAGAVHHLEADMEAVNG